MASDRHHLQVVLATVLLAGVVGCASDAATGPRIDAKRGGNGSPPSRLLLAWTQPGDYPYPMVIGSTFNVDFNIENPHRATEEIWVEVRVEQGNSWEIYRVVDDFDVDCGFGAGILPRNTFCTMTRPITISNSAPGSGTLTPGFARFRHRWYRGRTAPELLGDVANGTMLANP